MNEDGLEICWKCERVFDMHNSEDDRAYNEGHGCAVKP